MRLGRKTVLAFSQIVVTAIPVLLAGCAHHERVPPHVDTERVPPHVDTGAITIYVGGAVNTPGKLELSPPFTVEHGIQKAGGLDPFEQDQNRMVVIRRKGSQKISVPRKSYASFTLEEGDGVIVPRH